MRILPLVFLGILTATASTTACGPSQDARGPNRTPLAEKWLTRAQASYKAGDFEGAQVLAMIATATGEVVVDSSSRKEPAWVNLRFGSMEVKDVPALTQDLSAVSRQLGAPIKALLGVNLLRHMHVTFDRRGDQF